MVPIMVDNLSPINNKKSMRIVNDSNSTILPQIAWFLLKYIFNEYINKFYQCKTLIC